jgi:hypothetical protein
MVATQTYIDTSATGLEPDTLFELLSNSRRRAVLYVLYTRGRETPLSELVDEVARLDRDGPERSVSDPERNRVYVSLYQTHLPKLDGHGLVTFDTDDRTVSLTPAADRATVRRKPNRTPRHTRCYALIVLLGVVASLSAGPLGLFGGWPLVVMVTVSGLGLVVVHTRTTTDAQTRRSYILLSDLV